MSQPGVLHQFAKEPLLKRLIKHLKQQGNEFAADPAGYLESSARAALPPDPLGGYNAQDVPQMNPEATKWLADNVGFGALTVYHGGDPGIKQIMGGGGPGNTFGGLFASPSKESAMSHSRGALYEMNIPDEKILTQRAIDYDVPHDRLIAALKKSGNWADDELDDVYKAVAEDAANDIDLDTLLKIMREDDAASAGWEAQRIRGRLAKNLGYSAVEMADEHGTSYLVLPGVVPKLVHTNK